MKKSLFRSGNETYSYEYDETEKSTLERVKKITVDGREYTLEHQAKKGWTWESTANGIEIYFADENGTSICKSKEWLWKNAGRID